MRAILFKLGHMFVPLLLLALCFAAAYSAANYWLVIAENWLPLDRDVANAWLPGALGLMLTSIFIAPRLRALKRDKRGDLPFLYFLVAAAVVIAPTCFGQYYLAAETGRLVHVDRAEAISSAPPAAYYTAASACVDRRHPLVTERSELSGRHNESLDFNLYVLAPVCGAAEPHAWIALKYTGSVESGAPKEDKAAAYKAFAQRSQAQFDALDYSKVQYFEALGRTTDRRIYEKLLAEHARAAGPVMLIPHQDPFENRGGSELQWAVNSFGIGAGLFLLMLLFRPLDPEKVEEARLPRSARTRDKDSIWPLLIPRRDAYGLPILLDLNLGVYVAMVLSGLGVVSFQSDDLLAWGALYGPALHGLGFYRLVTSQFVHGGLMHLMSNMYGLLFGGMFLSLVLRRMGLIACYLACGLAAAAASVIVHPGTIGVGASGAIMGLFGVLTILAVLGDKRVVGARAMILTNCAIFAGLTVFQGAVVPGIDNVAHIAGFVAGMAIGLPILVFGWGEKPEPEVEDEAAGGQVTAIQ